MCQPERTSPEYRKKRIPLESYMRVIENDRVKENERSNLGLNKVCK